MYYSAAGERGTIGARGLERQRKFDGLRRWKFDTVMQMFLLLLQLGVLLFATALSAYLSTVHLSLAIIVLSFTCFGVITYITLLVSATISVDSPFQTPLVPLVARLIPTTLLRQYIRGAISSSRFTKRTWASCTARTRDLLPRVKVLHFLQRKSQNIIPKQDYPESIMPPTRWKRMARATRRPCRYVRNIQMECADYCDCARLSGPSTRCTLRAPPSSTIACLYCPNESPPVRALIPPNNADYLKSAKGFFPTHLPRYPRCHGCWKPRRTPL